ncbi:MAG: PepSY domain-containing protein [Bdellovibrionales bacterium]|nr:PepSY domain-containing protein [Bdellovibrionales bacterium]
MKRLILTSLVILSAASALAKKNCTDQPKDKWMTEEAFKQKAEEMGYKIRKFKQPGSCYEIYGKNKDGDEVETYFNPVDATVVKEEVEDDED